VDIVFDGIDHLAAIVRRRFPKSLLVMTLAAWLAVTAFMAWIIAVNGGWKTAGWVALPPLALLPLVAVYGLGRIGWPLWPVGVSPMVVLAGIVPIQSRDWDYSWVFPSLVFVYAQVYFGVVVTIDELRRRRTGHTEARTVDRVARRRVLQAKILIAMLVIFTLAQTGMTPYTPADPGWSRGQSVFQAGSFCFTAPAIIGLFLRRKGLAWFNAGWMLLVGVATGLAVDSSTRLTWLVQYGWIVGSAVYLWAKAARRWYWPWPAPAERPAWPVPQAAQPGRPAGPGGS
jgi:hypothetical protein